ncbi:MAG: hypothetical protein KatS3mg111_2977 [Pirellulaceae bacterium]|nr:MAG: hypothetical protein KatS3mg111_2977 [Pirellulaceae bacterium]
MPRWNKRLLLSPHQFAPSQEDLIVVGAFNPGATILDGRIVLVVRIAEQPREKRLGQVGLPRWEQGQVVVDWVAEDNLRWVDPRVVEMRDTGLMRLTFTSHLRVVVVEPGWERWEEVGRWYPQGPLESYGIEDPRIGAVEQRLLVTYVAVSPHGVASALAQTDADLQFDRLGILFPPENKDVVIFPESVDGAYLAMHRPVNATRFSKPEIWLANSHNLLEWGNHRPLAIPSCPWNADRVGGGCPPMVIADRFVALIHGATRPEEAGKVGRYAAALLVLDRHRPDRVLSVTPLPALAPSEPYEIDGFVPHVVFPTGWIVKDEQLHIFYGAADTHVAVASVSIDQFSLMVT